MAKINQTDYDLVEKYLSNPLWRLNNLYQIVNKRGNQITFTLNWAQKQLYEEMHYCNIVLKARQLGISTFICLYFLDKCLFGKNVSAGIIAHTLEDGQQLFRRIKFAYDMLPEDIRKIITADNDTAQMLKFSNGSAIRVGTSLRSSTMQYLHISEFGKICAQYPDKAREIITGSLNTLGIGQYCFIESTAEGREGYFFDMCQQSKAMHDSRSELSQLDFKFHFYPWWRDRSYRIGSCPSIPNELYEYFLQLSAKGIDLDSEQQNWYALRYKTQGEDMKREFPSTPEECWEVSNAGTYYARYITSARIEKRIGHIPYDDGLMVHTAWDLGFNDATTIWYFQVHGKEIRLIDYDEGSGESLQHWLNVVLKKPYTYDMHLAPHDIMVHEYTSGMTRQATAFKLGISLIPVSKVDIINGIDAARNILNRCWFNETKCDKGIKALENYKKEWDERHGCWRSSPLHNWASHGCFTGDTLLLTRFGRLPIMLIEKDMEILTLKGWKKCNKATVMKKNAQLVEVKLSDGMNVRCTPDHLFLTKKGWISAENLKKDTKIQSSLMHSRHILEDHCIGFGLKRDTLKKADRICIEMFGKTLLVKFLENVTYIIKTMISKITNYTIWNVCPIIYISNSRDQILNLYQIRLEKRQENGINQPKAENGIEDKRLDQKVGQNGKEKTKNALFAKKFIHLLLEKAVMLKNTVLQNVSPLHVLDVIKLNEKEDVYCINVPEIHHFSLSNGCVVHNSDAFRTLACGLHFITGKKSKVETERERLESAKDSSGLLPGHYLYDIDTFEKSRNIFRGNRSRTF